MATVVRIAFVCYCLALAFVLLNPNVGVPTGGIGWVADTAGAVGTPGWVLEPRRFEFVCNALIFAPLPILGAFSWRGVPVAAWLGIGLVASGLVELAQLLFLPERSATVIDVVANTTGAAAGVAAVALIRACC